MCVIYGVVTDWWSSGMP